MSGFEKHAKPPAREEADPHCRVDIRIDTQGPVNIYNCTGGPPGPEPCPEPCPPSACEPPTGPIAPGQCVPLSIGSKPKQSLRTKLDSLLQNAKVPSAIASGFFQHARRFGRHGDDDEPVPPQRRGETRSADPAAVPVQRRGRLGHHAFTGAVQRSPSRSVGRCRHEVLHRSQPVL